MKLWRRTENIDHREAEAALAEEKRARIEIEAKKVELDAKRPMAELISQRLAKHLQENNFSGLLRRALEAQSEHH